MSLIPHLYDVARPLRLMEKELFSPDDFLRPSSFNQLVPREFFNPWNSMLQPWQDLIKPMEELAATMNHMASNTHSNIIADDEKFQVNVDVQHFSPEDLNVKVIDKHVVIEGKHEEKQDEHGYVSRRFVRRYALPQGCLPDTVQSSLSSDGVLTVTAPKILRMPSTGERIVPVTHTGPVGGQIGSSDSVPKENESNASKENNV